MVDTSDEWIVQRTGIKKRHIAADDVFATDLGAKAVEDMLSRSGASIEDTDLIIAASFTPDFLTPAVAAVLHGKLGLKPTCGSFDMNAACAGFVHALLTAQSYITTGMCRKVLVVAAEALSKITDWKDRASCVLFGDGAAAALLEYDENGGNFLSSWFGSDGANSDKLYTTGLSTRMNGQELPIKKYFWQDGRAVYNFTIKVVPEGIKSLAEKAGIPLSGISWFVPHSANLRIIQSICEKLPFPFEQALTSVEEYGNTSSATIPLALWEGLKSGRLKKGDICLLYGFGGGLNHAGTIVRW